MANYYSKDNGQGVTLLAMEKGSGEITQISFDESNNIAEVKIITDLTGFDPENVAKYIATWEQVKNAVDNADSED